MTKDLGSNTPQLISIFEQTVDHFPQNLAIICDHLSLTYAALDQKANQLAHYLNSIDIHAGDTVSVLLPRSLDCYIAMLALYKIGAIYVPIAEEYPAERINHILSDMNFALMITNSEHEKRSDIQHPKTLIIQDVIQELSQQSKERPPKSNFESELNPTCYVIYTSGSTGKPNGVEVGHNSICHYISVASSTYGIQAEDRIYHGFSLAFDASFEEIWMAFANGATLIVATSKDIRSGLGLIDFLNQHEITVFSTVPTLLSNLKGAVESLRLLILGGEVCTPNIVSPWVRSGLKIMNTYGPTEATVVTTVAEYIHNQPLTIGKPLPGYEILLLDEQLRMVQPGEAGELCIAGSGLAKGYVNRSAITATKFIQNPLNPKKRLYRTGDLAQWNEAGDLIFLGRIDDQVKLRGFRLELNEIETVLMTYPDINQAVVSLVQQSDEPKLVAYYISKTSKKITPHALKTFLSKHLPAFMLPSIYEPLDIFPLLPSGKVNRKQLPIPKSKPQTNAYRPPKTALEIKIAGIMAGVLKIPQISVTDDFFYDLGGHSLTAASIISELRKCPECQHLSIVDLYQHRTIQKLAKNVDKNDTHPHTKSDTSFESTNKWGHRWSTLGQSFGILLGYALSSWQIFIFLATFFWVSYRYPMWSLTSIKIFLGLAIAVPLVSLAIVITAKWVLLGRVRAGKHRLWGWFYLRWWLVMRLEQMLFPVHHFVGTPLMTLYYRLMGAKIGKHTQINTSNLSMHDLIAVGDYTAINHDAVLKAYYVEDGWLHLGPITLGTNCYVGVRAVLSIHTHIEDGAALEDLSMVPAQHTLTSNTYYSGSPAQKIAMPAKHLLHTDASPPVSKLQSWGMGFLQCLAILLVEIIHYGLYVPPLYWIASMYAHTSLIQTIFLIPFAALMYLGLLGAATIGFKKITRPLKSGRYDFYSFTWLKHWILLKLLELPEILAMADSLYFPIFLRALGAKLGIDVETSEMAHISPDLVSIHDHGFVAAYASIGASKLYQGYVFFGQATIGKESFIGNRGVLPQDGHLYESGLLGCLSTMPADPEHSTIKHATWLGSPPILLPNREVNPHPDSIYDHPTLGMKYARFLIEGLRILIPSTLMLCNFFLLYAMFLINFSPRELFVLFPVIETGIMVSIVGIFALLKWIVIGAYKPNVFPLWHPFIRRKDIVEYTYGYFLQGQIINLIIGSPFLTYFLRLLGTKIGKYNYIETGSFEEFDLIHIGDEVEINSNAIIQTHLYEDRVFKMSHIHIHSRCNIGRDSIILYDTTMEEHSKIGSLSLLMKGETLPKNTVWEGCPAQTVEE